MKQLFLTLTFCIFSATVLLAQPTLTQATNSPVVGDAFNCYQSGTFGGFGVGASGAAVTWNFSTLGTGFLETYSYVSCTTTPYFDSFPSANIALVYSSSGVTYDYYKSTGSIFSYVGGRGFSSKYYTNPEDDIYYPLTYTSTHVDTAVYHSASNNYVHYNNFTCDGYGTLILPFDTFYNVLRVHEVQLDSLVGVSSKHKENYRWYTSGFHINLLDIQYDSIGVGLLPSNVLYFTSKPPASVTNINESNTQFSICPNPANNELILKTDNTTDAFYFITDCMGAIVLKGTMHTSTTKLDIAALPTGIYYVKLIAVGGSEVKRLLKL